MKRAIVLLAVGFSLAYCNPTQQADQTTTTGNMTDSTSGTTSGTTTGTDTSGTMRDTTSHPDSLPH